MGKVGCNRIGCFLQASEAIRGSLHELEDLRCSFGLDPRHHVHQHQALGRLTGLADGEQ
ncbi:hypothetical protein D9M68_975770 [compost metagenome]